MLKKKAIQIRKDILMMLEKAGSGHTGGSLSLVEILLVLYTRALKHDPKNPSWRERDKVILSKGHGCPALYAVLADSGYFPGRSFGTCENSAHRFRGIRRSAFRASRYRAAPWGRGFR